MPSLRDTVFNSVTVSGIKVDDDQGYTRSTLKTGIGNPFIQQSTHHHSTLRPSNSTPNTNALADAIIYTISPQPSQQTSLFISVFSRHPSRPPSHARTQLLIPPFTGKPRGRHPVPRPYNPSTSPFTAAKLASLPNPRVSARLPQKLSRCLRGNDWASRGSAPSRCFASAASTPHQNKTPKAIPPELAGSPSTRPWQSSDLNAQTLASSPTPSKFHIPSVILPADAAKSGPVHKIHILGDDVRSRFIAHALCGVYDSVELLGYRSMPKSRYRNVEAAQPERTRRSAYAEPNAVPVQTHVKAAKSHIDQLIITGRGFEAVKAMESVKDRVNENTSVCLLNDGMGVLEDAREHIFKDTKSTPNFILGHMSHALVYNRNRNSVKELKSGRTVLTQTNPTLYTKDFAESLQEIKSLRTTSGSFENWMRFKLPSMVFTAAVEPVCVLLEIPYQNLLENRSAQSMMNQLLEEIVTVVDHMPELQGAMELRRFIRGESLKKWCYQRITGKASAPSDLLQRVEKGLQTDIKYQNGFFQKRAKTLGIDIPTNTLMVQMIKARRAEALARRESYIKMEEKSIDDLRALSPRRGTDEWL
ncbi:hypothetical protein AK830_g12397 [Neonectria ditissima]|uniref:Ketopantoate reductase C-terminal domain-containing protein n=1 Tax=Neonectria ditissima TaxID=78410 RepID=A0A0P7AZ60_9HYPO|nr:hypothetical protein AK830_g12397 [Neonectria ditissima]